MSRRRQAVTQDEQYTEATLGEDTVVVAPSEDRTTTEQRVRTWVADNMSHGRIARDVDLWNELQAAIPALVAAIDA